MSIEHPLALGTGLAMRSERHASRLAAVPPPGASGPRAEGLRTRPAEAAPVGADEAPVWAALLGGRPLTPAELEALAGIARRRVVDQGQSVLSRSGDVGQLVALRSGEVALGLRTADGVFRTERIERGPAWLDLSAAWLSASPAIDAVALSPSTLLELPRQALEQRLAAHHGLALRLIQSLAREVRALASNTHELMHKDAPARLAQWLHQRCEPLPGRPHEGVVRLHERKRDVASQLAITPETLSRLMRSFAQQGVIEVAGYTLRVLDTEALARLAQS